MPYIGKSVSILEPGWAGTEASWEITGSQLLYSTVAQFILAGMGLAYRHYHKEVALIQTKPGTNPERNRSS